MQAELDYAQTDRSDWAREAKEDEEAALAADRREADEADEAEAKERMIRDAQAAFDTVSGFGAVSPAYQRALDHECDVLTSPEVDQRQAGMFALSCILSDIIAYAHSPKDVIRMAHTAKRIVDEVDK